MTSNSEGRGDFFTSPVNHFTSSGRDSVEYPGVPGLLHRTWICATTRSGFTGAVWFADAPALLTSGPVALLTKRKAVLKRVK